MSLASVKQGSVRTTKRTTKGIPRRISGNSLVDHYNGRSLPRTLAVTAEENFRDLSSYLIAAQEVERTRIARELHDDLSQRMALLRISLDQLMQQLPEAVHREQLSALAHTADEISTQLHNISHELHPAKLESLGIVAAFSSHCGELSLRHGLQIEFEQQCVPEQIPPDVTLCLYRILQETLRNVLKHSGAKKATVKLRGSPFGIELSISDTGVGFGMAQRRQGGGGLGLISIEERLRLVKGELTIESAPSRGTRISVWVPLLEGYRVSARSKSYGR